MKQQKLFKPVPEEKAPATIQVEAEIQASYIDYAMSVIVGRALPDVRDGLKPVHRRILYAMDELGLRAARPHRKSARIVGDCLGRFHPHGDTAVYDALVRMAQDFSLRYMLVDGQGNFGSVDGDAPAAMRYTEARLSPIAEELLKDLDKETVDFGPNFDGSLQEPLVLPSAFPNLLVNGSSGIAVGMATNIPPHNLGEVVDGTVALIDNPELTVKELMKFIPGPDFPTGAIICGKAGVRQAYETGRGLLQVRAKTDFEEVRGKKEAIIVTELPYQVNKAQLIEQIAGLVKDKKLSGIADLRDESDRQGMRIYIELKRDANREIVLNQLFKHTALQSTFGINSLALVNGVPRLLPLKDLIQEFINHREQVVTRRTQFELRKAEEQAHLLEGLRIAISNLDAVIKLIRNAKTVPAAREGLMKQFKLSERQAQAILDMRLQRLTALEREKLEKDYQDLKKRIKALQELLASRKKILGVVKEELLELKRRFADKRRTAMMKEASEMEAEDLIADEDVVILMTRDGFVKRLPIGTFRAQLRGGRGVMGMNTREEDQIDQIFVASTHSSIYFFTNKGRAFRLKIYELPEASRQSKGQSIAHLLSLRQGERVTAAIAMRKGTEVTEKSCFIMATELGLIKKTALSEFDNIRRSGIAAIGLKGEDQLVWVRLVQGDRELVLITARGMIIRFHERQVRPMGRAAAGVRGIALAKGDKVISMEVVADGADLLIVSQGGYGKRTSVKGYRSQSRGGKGLIVMKMRKEDGVARAAIVQPDDEILFVTLKGTISRQRVSGISRQSRQAKGVRIQRLDAGDAVVDMARVESMDEVAKEVEG